MSAFTDLDLARDYGAALEDRHRRRGLPAGRAREAAARDAGVSPGFLENLRKGRIKKEPGRSILDGLRLALCRAIEREIKALEHEHALVVAARSGADRVEVGEVEAALAKARAAIGRSAG